QAPRRPLPDRQGPAQRPGTRGQISGRDDLTGFHSGGLMAEVIKPVAKAVYVCDDVVSDPQTGKVSVLNLWDTVRVPENGFPYQLPKVVVCAWVARRLR